MFALFGSIEFMILSFSHNIHISYDSALRRPCSTKLHLHTLHFAPLLSAHNQFCLHFRIFKSRKLLFEFGGSNCWMCWFLIWSEFCSCWCCFLLLSPLCSTEFVYASSVVLSLVSLHLRYDRTNEQTTPNKSKNKNNNNCSNNQNSENTHTRKQSHSIVWHRLYMYMWYGMVWPMRFITFVDIARLIEFVYICVVNIFWIDK